MKLHPFDDTALKVAQDRRKIHIRNREWWQALQKECGRDNRELARFASDEAKEHLQWEKASTWAISFTLGTAPAYSPGGFLPGSWILNQMPAELESKIMHEFRCADYGIPARYIDEKEVSE